MEAAALNTHREHSTGGGVNAATPTLNQLLQAPTRMLHSTGAPPNGPPQEPRFHLITNSNGSNNNANHHYLPPPMHYDGNSAGYNFMNHNYSGAEYMQQRRLPSPYNQLINKEHYISNESNYADYMSRKSNPYPQEMESGPYPYSRAYMQSNIQNFGHQTMVDNNIPGNLLNRMLLSSNYPENKIQTHSATHSPHLLNNNSEMNHLLNSLNNTKPSIVKQPSTNKKGPNHKNSTPKQPKKQNTADSNSTTKVKKKKKNNDQEFDKSINIAITKSNNKSSNKSYNIVNNYDPLKVVDDNSNNISNISLNTPMNFESNTTAKNETGNSCSLPIYSTNSLNQSKIHVNPENHYKTGTENREFNGMPHTLSNQMSQISIPHAETSNSTKVQSFSPDQTSNISFKEENSLNLNSPASWMTKPSLSPKNQSSLSPLSNKDDKNTVLRVKKNEPITKLYEFGNEPNRKQFLDLLLRFNEQNANPIPYIPTVSKAYVDLYRLYHMVKDRGGILMVNQRKLWREIATQILDGHSASASYNLRKQYIKCLLDYECKFDLNGADPLPIISQIESTTKKKKKKIETSQSLSDMQDSQNASNISLSDVRQQEHSNMNISNDSFSSSQIYPPSSLAMSQSPLHNKYNVEPFYNSVSIPAQERVNIRNPFSDDIPMPSYNNQPINTNVNFESSDKSYTRHPIQQKTPFPNSNSIRNMPMHAPMEHTYPNQMNSTIMPERFMSPQNIKLEMASNTDSNHSYPLKESSPIHSIDNIRHQYKNQPLPLNKFYYQTQPSDNSFVDNFAQNPNNVPSLNKNHSDVPFIKTEYHPSPYPPPKSNINNDMPKESQTCLPPHMVHIKNEMHNKELPMPMHQNDHIRHQLHHPPPMNENKIRPEYGNYDTPYHRSKYPFNSNIYQDIPPNVTITENSIDPKSLKFSNSRISEKFYTSSSYIPREIIIPPNTVEATIVKPQKFKKIHSKDLGTVDIKKLTMSLKSGIFHIYTSVIDTLNVLLADESKNPQFLLSQHPDLLDLLIEYFETSLESVFNLKLTAKSQVNTAKTRDYVKRPPIFIPDRKAKTKYRNGKNYTWITRNKRRVIVDEKSLITPSPLQTIYSDESFDISLLQTKNMHLDPLIVPFRSDLITNISLLNNDNVPKRNASDIDVDIDKHSQSIDNRNIHSLVNFDDFGHSLALPHSTSFSSISTSLYFPAQEYRSKSLIHKLCLSLSNIFRSLSFIPGNEGVLCSDHRLCSLLARLLLLKHIHPSSPLSDKFTLIERDFWLALSKDALVTLSNLTGKLDLSLLPDITVISFIDGLAHTLLCPHGPDISSTLVPNGPVSRKFLALECLCKLSVAESNADHFLACLTLPRLESLLRYLIRLLLLPNQHQNTETSDIVLKEASLVLLSNLGRADPTGLVFNAIGHHPHSLSAVVRFMEEIEANASRVIHTQGFPALRDNPELMGTSLSMLRRSANLLLNVAHKTDDKERIFAKFHNRLLNLVMSQILDQNVANILAHVLYLVSTPPNSIISCLNIASL
ncbi:putative uncharacterized protein DDB_G0282133 [Gordionus sp. m RMFG-2023]|uniref:putative uncharacterized protein DDB_G0282133 n=1 Tax=Gordionus sp. m RMFG-2023 TaxID=3053472 RepID=UPI0031FCD564